MKKAVKKINDKPFLRMALESLRLIRKWSAWKKKHPGSDIKNKREQWTSQTNIRICQRNFYRNGQFV